MTKQEVLDKLELLGWEYIGDEFTHSKYGHRRERFEKTEQIDGNYCFVDGVLIFHYLRGTHDEPHIQLYSIGDYDLEKAKKRLYMEGRTCCLYIEELELFLEYMKIIQEEDKKEDELRELELYESI